MQLSSFNLLAVNAGDEASDVSKELLIAAAVGLAVGVAWSALCVALHWPVIGWAGIALGFFVGGAMVALLRSAASPLAGVVAAVLAMLTLAVAAGFESRSDSQSTITAAQSDASFIAAIAEQILWERATPKLDAQGQPLPSAAPSDSHITAGVAPDAIPADVNQEAAARWAAMPDVERQNIRDQRQRWMTVSLGPDMNQLERPVTGWPPAAVVALAGVVAMLSAAWPAFAARYCGMFDR